MDAIERITPERVAAAYAKCGLKPTTLVFYDESSHTCCALTAIAIAERGVDPSRFDDGSTESIIQDGIVALGLDLEYVRGFVGGFDCPRVVLSRYKSTPDVTCLGDDDGRAAAIHLGLYTPEED